MSLLWGLTSGAAGASTGFSPEAAGFCSPRFRSISSRDLYASFTAFSGK
jgi:hypothetical protein